MSVEKVNKYKEDKKNRKQILEQEKKKKNLYRLGGWLVSFVLVVALVVMLGLTARNAYNSYQASKPDYNSTSLAISDMTGILDHLEEDEDTAAGDEKKAEKEEAENTSAAEDSAETSESSEE